MKRIAVLTTTVLLTIGGSSAAYTAVASTPHASPSVVRTGAGAKAVEPRHHARHAEPGDDRGRRHAERGDDRGHHGEHRGGHRGEHHGGHGSDG